MVLNGLITLAIEDEEENDPCQLQPGWDDQEIEVLQNTDNSE